MIISPPEKTFRQNLLVRLSLLVLPAIAWVVVLVQWFDKPQLEPISTGIALAVTALWGLAWVLIGKSELTLHAEGLRRSTVFGSSEMAWSEITETRFAQVPVSAQVGAHFGLIGYLVVALSGKGGGSGQKSLEVVGTNGRKLKITSNWRDSDEALRGVLARVNPRLIEGHRQRLKSGETLKFGNVGLSRQGVSWKNGEPIPFATLAKCKIEGANLRIKAEGKWLDNVSVNASKVPNIFILLDLVEEMRSGGAPAAPDPLARAAGI